MNDWIQLDTSQYESLGRVNLRLNRPDRRNALTRGMLESLLECLAQIRSLQQTRILVLQSTGSVFCAGMDLGEMQQHAGSPDKEQQWQRDSELYCELLTGLFQLPFPTIAQVQGPVLAGGVGLVLACDLVLATNETFFALPEPVRGITAAIVTPFLQYRLGAGIAGQWLLSGGRVTAESAFRAGLCLALTSSDTLADSVDQSVSQILTGAPAALAITKRHWHDCSGAAQVVEQARQSIAVSAEARETEDAREGLAAFLDKRSPRWTPQQP